MDKDMQSEVISAWAQKGSIERSLMVGMHGITEFKRDEKMHYLGEFKERVIRLLSQDQVAEIPIYSEIARALQDKRATRMIINGSMSNRFIEKYMKLAKKMNKPYTVRSNPDFQGETGLMVISNEAVGTLVITVEDRSVRLKRLGISSALIDSIGKKVCKKCLAQILKVDPREATNYKKLTFFDRIGGERCPAHQVRQ